GTETGFSQGPGLTPYGNPLEGKHGSAADPQAYAFANFVQGLPASVTGLLASPHIASPHVQGSGAFQAFGQAVVDAFSSVANTYLSSRGGSSTATKGAVGTNWQGSWVQVMAQIAKKKGWSLPDWRQVVQIESGGVPSILGRPT